MSTIYDVESLHVESDEGRTASANAVTALEVAVEAPMEVTTVMVAVEGPQGPPGMRNVYVSESDPSKDQDGNTIWGEKEKDYVWIEVL